MSARPFPARLTLLEKQQIFAAKAAQLIQEAMRLGYRVTLGEAWRSPQEAERLAALGKGIKTSLHIQRLAIDLNLFRDGKWLSRTEHYRPLGEWWERQSEAGIDCAWGGRFTERPDGGHFSIRDRGRA